MSDELKSIQNYIHAIEKKLALGDATEHTHRSSLETMVESLAEGITATNEPKHIECGAPDFILRKGSVTVGYIEAKDIGKSLGVRREYLWQLAGLLEDMDYDAETTFADPQLRFRFARVDKMPDAAKNLINGLIDAVIIFLERGGGAA